MPFVRHCSVLQSHTQRSNRPCGEPAQGLLLGALGTGSEAASLLSRSSQVRLLHVRGRNRHGVCVRRRAHRMHHSGGGSCPAADPHQERLPLPRLPQRQATPHASRARRHPRVGSLAAAVPEVTCQHATCTAQCTDGWWQRCSAVLNWTHLSFEAELVFAI